MRRGACFCGWDGSIDGGWGGEVDARGPCEPTAVVRERGAVPAISIFKGYRQDFGQEWCGLATRTDFPVARGHALGLSAADIAALDSGRMRIASGGYDRRLKDLRSRPS